MFTSRVGDAFSGCGRSDSTDHECWQDLHCHTMSTTLSSSFTAAKRVQTPAEPQVAQGDFNGGTPHLRSNPTRQKVSSNR